MIKTILVSDGDQQWGEIINDIPIVNAKDYISNPELFQDSRLRVINLCTDYRYQKLGYYVSLLAQARGHRVFPSSLTIQDINSSQLTTHIATDLHDLIHKTLKPINSKSFVLSVYFGKNLAKRYDGLCHKLCQLFPMPMFRISFECNKHWQIKNIQPMSIQQIPAAHLAFVQLQAQHYFHQKRFYIKSKKQYRYDLAILVNAQDKTPPSNEAALQKFIQAAERKGVFADFLSPNEERLLVQYDALFIRETTAVNHHTYRFSRKAQELGLITIDDPHSILTCTNKVYLAELLRQHRLPTPKTWILSKEQYEQCSTQLSYPCVIKLPDSAFSLGVNKVESVEEFHQLCKKLFKQSELILVQNYMPTDYDWRIGILDDKPLFACQYFMAKGHWQIYNWQNNEDDQTGMSETIAINEVPTAVLDLALKGSRLIGRGLYGVDIKVVDKQPYIIEINDNPSIEHGIEDCRLGDGLYDQIIDYFLKYLEKSKTYGAEASKSSHS